MDYFSYPVQSQTSIKRTGRKDWSSPHNLSGLTGSFASWCQWGIWHLSLSGPVRVLDGRSRLYSGWQWCCATSENAAGPHFHQDSKTKNKKIHNLSFYLILPWTADCRFLYSLSFIIINSSEIFTHLKPLIRPTEPLERFLTRVVFHPGFHGQLQSQQKEGKEDTHAKLDASLVLFWMPPV